MVSTKRQPPSIAGQAAFTEIAEFVRPEIDLERKEPFAIIARPEFWSIDAEPYGVVTYQMLGAISADRIKPDLFAERDDPTHHIVGGVAMNDGEYNLILRSPATGFYAARTESRSRERNRLMEMDRRQERAEEEAVLGFERKAEKMTTYVERSLGPALATLANVHEAASHPGLRRRRNVVTIGEVATVKDVIFPGILEVVGLRRNWTAKQAKLAELSLTAALFFKRTDNKHLGVWRDWTQLGIDYKHAIRGIFSNRIAIAESAAKKYKSSK